MVCASEIRTSSTIESSEERRHSIKRHKATEIVSQNSKRQDVRMDRYTSHPPEDVDMELRYYIHIVG